MGVDSFTAEIEWCLRMRRESSGICRLLRRLRVFLKVAGSSQDEGSIRVWVSPEVEQMHEDVERVLAVLDPSTARFLEGPAVSPTAYLAKGTAGALGNGVGGVVEDARAIKGPGRRHGYRHA